MKDGFVFTGRSKKTRYPDKGTAYAKTYTGETACLMDMNGVKFM